jgi:hypothetical protein
MGHEPVRQGGEASRRAGFLRLLYRQGAQRWIVLSVALALLVVLGIYAGKLRNPLAVKRGWAVTVSRVLACAAGFFVVRLVLLSYEERVPVLLFDLRSSKGRVQAETVAEAIRRLQGNGFEVVPLGDVVEFVRERRYVPKKCLGLVVEIVDVWELDGVRKALPDVELAVLLPPEAFESHSDRGEKAATRSISLGVSLVGDPAARDAGQLKALLAHVRTRAIEATGCEPHYVRVDPGTSAGLRGSLKDTTYVCFLDGKGFNRFGDEADMLRLLDVTPIVEGPRAGAGLSAYIGLFAGKYYLWPSAAARRRFGGGREVT